MSVQELAYPHGEVLSSEVRNKYIVGQVDLGDQLGFIKAPLDSRHIEDLENEVRWNAYVGPHITDETTSVPAVLDHDLEQGWVVYEWVEGEQPSELDIAQNTDRLATLAAKLTTVPLGRPGSDLAPWFAARMEQLGGVLNSDFFTKAHRLLFKDAVSADMPAIPAGVIHGDLIFKNILENGSKWHVIDGEFGTVPERPEWDKPRYHDAAYIYHLLRCQYQDPTLAETFLDSFAGQLPDQTVSMVEFNSSVLERTLSMMSHFVVNRNHSKKVDDARRIEPRPYITLIEQTLAELVEL